MNNHYLIGMDVGGSYVKIGAINESYDVIKRLEIPTKAHLNAGQIVKYWTEHVQKLISELSPKKPTSIGLGIPGTLDKKRQKLLSAPNLKNLTGFAIRPYFEKLFSLPVELDNDVNAFTWGEYNLHWKNKYQNIIAISLGTGVGGGIIIGGKLYRGKGNAGEFGHTIVDYDGYDCPCGSKGCLEQYASTTRLIKNVENKLLNDYLQKGKNVPVIWLKNSKTSKINSINELFIDGKMVTIGARAKDPIALSAFDEMGKYLGLGSASLANAFDPELIIVGGGIIGGKSFFLPRARFEFKNHVMNGIGNNIKILPAKGKDSAIIGAALLNENP